MHRILTPAGITLSSEKYGSGPPLVLVHGSFSNHESNWEFVKPLFEPHFTVYAIARRGRGETDRTTGHSLRDESADVAALLESLDETAFLLGHSYGAQVALAAAALVPARVRRLVLYEPPWPSTMSPETLQRLEEMAAGAQWDAFATTFFHETLEVPLEELDGLRETDLWAPIVADAEATLGDLRALSRYEFDEQPFREILPMPVLLQVGTESPRDFFITDALAAVLPQARIEALHGQAHEAMTTAPDEYAAAVMGFLLQ